MRVRVKELAQEAKFIRLEENKIKSGHKLQMPCYPSYKNNYNRWHADSKTLEFMRLRTHRTHNVRDAARAAQLAYGFMRDVPYRRIEVSPKPMTSYYEKLNWDSIVKEIKRLATKFSRYGNTKFDEEIEKWLTS
jgi:hypothetical protein